MPNLTSSYVPHYVAAPPTEENLEYADLAIMDISKAATEEGRAALTIKLEKPSSTTYSSMSSIFKQYHTNRDVTKQGHPEALRPILPEIQEFSKHDHFNMLHPIHISWLIARSFELPEDMLVNKHDYDAVGETADTYLSTSARILMIYTMQVQCESASEY
ncbi:uncharacterized protein EDB91DRAFT_1337230 [Suillus paluster]|uniref:uncharacterized protein n=1 Tax=Suillus paluster TaxID=48578 RepID=UPI001B869791|nr:uncharacterized protein EDB91DRAFT_1337230 [Suillus paluster]KAG1737543.1 hypothetical protein EDB91DRAFT_1337230 [Suillus paluster]